MLTRRVDPRSIMVPEVRVTSRFDEETWAQFQRSIAADPNAVFVICSEVDGQLVLVDGLHRLQQVLQAGRPYIDVALVDGDMVDVLTMNLKLDHLRGKHPPSEMVKVIEALTREYHLDSDQIAEKTGLTRDYVEKLQQISTVTPLIREALDREEIKVGHAYALAKIDNPVQQETVFFQLQMYRWTVKATEEFIAGLKPPEPPPERGPEPARDPVMVRCAYCQEEYDVTSGEIANPNTCRSCAGVMAQSMAEARRMAAIEAKQRELETPPQESSTS